MWALGIDDLPSFSVAFSGILSLPLSRVRDMHSKRIVSAQSCPLRVHSTYPQRPQLETIASSLTNLTLRTLATNLGHTSLFAYTDIHNAHTERTDAFFDKRA